MEKHVVNLELSKKLKELGVKQESEFYWIIGEDNGLIYNKNLNGECSGIASAFLSSELGELFPGRLRLEDADYWFRTAKSKDGDYFDVRYHRFSNINMHEKVLHWEQSETEANARAKMLIHLIETKLI